jgi:hypothetical protein
MQGTDEVWLWSEAFTDIVASLIDDPGSNSAEAGFDWPKHRQRLTWWMAQVEGARELYRRGHAEALQLLYDYWRNIAGDDAHEQARFARETYRQLPLAASA